MFRVRARDMLRMIWRGCKELAFLGYCCATGRNYYGNKRKIAEFNKDMIEICRVIVIYLKRHRNIKEKWGPRPELARDGERKNFMEAEAAKIRTTRRPK